MGLLLFLTAFTFVYSAGNSVLQEIEDSYMEEDEE